MLWAVEQNPRDWWEKYDVIVICSVLLNGLKLRLESKMLEHYFIPEWILFDLEMNKSKRMDCICVLNSHCDRQTLAGWFIGHYLNQIPGGIGKYITDTEQAAEFNYGHAARTNIIPQYFNSVEIHRLSKEVCSSLIKHQLQVGAKKYYDLAWVLLHLATFLTPEYEEDNRTIWCIGSLERIPRV